MDKHLPMSYNDMKQIANDFIGSGLFAQFKNPQQALVTIMAGREFGLGPFEAMTSIYVVQGKPSFYSHKFADMIKRSGKYKYRVQKHDDKLCSIDFYEMRNDGGWESVGNSTFTIEDAQKADLTKNPNFTKYPRNMLYARAMSNGAKWHCPDAFHGTGAYEPSELGADVKWDEDGTQTVVSAPEPEPQAEPKVYKPASVEDTSESLPTEETSDASAADTENTFTIVEDQGNRKVTDSKVLTVNTFKELQTANGQPYGQIEFMDIVKVKDFEPKWNEYNISYWIYEEQPDVYRSLENGTRVLCKLTFENKVFNGAEKNYQNVQVIRVMEDDEI